MAWNTKMNADNREKQLDKKVKMKKKLSTKVFSFI